MESNCASHLNALAALVLAMATLPDVAHAQAASVRLATLAPRGTSLHKTLLAMGEEWRGAPCGGVKLTIYPDGTLGREEDMVNRPRIGQIQAAMLRGTGLRQHGV